MTEEEGEQLQSNPLFASDETQSSTTDNAQNQLSTDVLPNDYWLSVRMRTWFRSIIMDSRSKAIPLLTSRWNWALPTSLSNYILSPKAKFLSALAPATARETCVTAIATITTTVRKGVDVCGKNYRYLQAAREDERCLIKMQTLPTVLNQTCSSETSTLRTRE